MPRHPSFNFEIEKYHKNYKNELRFKGIYSRGNLPKRSFVERNFSEVKDEAYIINLGKYSDIGTHWVALYVQNRLEYLSVIKTWKQIFLEYKHVIL